MTTTDDLGKEAADLESTLFTGDGARLLDALRTGADAAPRRELLQGLVKIHDRAFLDRLVALGIGPETALAVTLVPLVLVAWADGELGERERSAILRAAEERGVAAGQGARRLLAGSLAQKPDPRLFPRWEALVRRLWGCFTHDERWRMRCNLLGAARDVATAAGGFLGLTSGISAAEAKVLERLEQVLD